MLQHNIYIFIGILLLLNFILSEIPFKNLIKLALVSGGFYLYLKKDQSDNQNLLKKIQDKNLKTKDKNTNFKEVLKYKHVLVNNDILSIIKSLEPFSKYNIEAFNEAINYLDNFLRIINDLDNNIEYKHHNINYAKDQRKNFLNSLNSMFIGLPVSKGYLIEDKFLNLVKKNRYFN